MIDKMVLGHKFVVVNLNQSIIGLYILTCEAIFPMPIFKPVFITITILYETVISSHIWSPSSSTTGIGSPGQGFDVSNCSTINSLGISPALSTI